MLSIEERLRDLPRPVTLVYYTPDVPSAATRAEHLLREDIARGAARIELRVLAERWDNVAVLPYLAVRYHADDTPTTVVNGRKAWVGVLEEDEFVSRLLDAGESPVPRTRARRRRREGRTRP